MFINTLNYKKNEFTILGISLLNIFCLETNLSLSVTHGKFNNLQYTHPRVNL